MLAENPDTLDDLIREEKHRVAAEFFGEAWQAAGQEGIDAPIAADSAITTVLSELHRTCGEAAVLRLVDTLADRAEAGAFQPDLVLQ